MKRFFLNCRIRHALLLLCFLFSGLSPDRASAQIVPNGGFETKTSTPNFINPCNSTDYLQLYGTDWFYGNGGTSDYFHTQASSGFLGSVNVPYNTFTPSNKPIHAHGGNAYAGILITTPGREYVQRELSISLVAGQVYQVSFWVCHARNRDWNATNPTYSLAKLGAHFSTTANRPSATGCWDWLNVTPQVCSGVNGVPVLNPTSFDWQLVTGSFTAQGGERWITIGNFETSLTVTGASNYNGQTDNFIPPPNLYDVSTYYYIDDVSVTGPMPCPNCNIMPAPVLKTKMNTNGECCYNLQALTDYDFQCYVYGMRVRTGSNQVLYSELNTTQKQWFDVDFCTTLFNNAPGTIYVEYLGSDSTVICTKQLPIAPCQCDCSSIENSGSKFEIKLVPKLSADTNMCCYDIVIDNKLACQHQIASVALNYNGNGSYASVVGMSGIGISMVNGTITLGSNFTVNKNSTKVIGSICIPKGSPSHNLSFNLSYKDANGNPVQCNRNWAQTIDCQTCGCEEDWGLILEPMPYRFNGNDECCYRVKAFKKRANACKLYGFSIQMPGSSSQQGQWSSMSPILSSVADTIDFGFHCLPPFTGTKQVTIRFWSGTPAANENVRPPDCVQTQSIQGCLPTCCDNISAWITGLYGPSNGQCCWSLFINQANAPGCGIYRIAVSDNNIHLPYASDTSATPMNFNNTLYRTLCKGVQPSGASGVFTIKFYGKTANGTDTLICTKSIPYSCGKTGDIDCCDNLDAFIQPHQYTTPGKCCWDLYITQKFTPECEIVGVKVYDGNTFMPAASSCCGLPMHFPDPTGPLGANFRTICMPTPASGSVSGVFKIEFYGKLSNGTIVLLCTKNVPYSCGTPEPECCDDINVSLTVPAVSPGDKCCWELRITQVSQSDCDIYGVKVYKNNTLVNQQSSSTQMYFTDPNLYPVPVFTIICEQIPASGTVSGTIRVEFYGKDANGNEVLLCTKEIPYSCGSCGSGGPAGGDPPKAGSANDIPANRTHQLSLHPNPSVDEATISFHMDEAATVKIEVYNMLGEAVDLIAEGAVQKGMNSIRYATSKLQNGSYIVRLKIDGKTLSIPMTVSR